MITAVVVVLALGLLSCSVCLSPRDVVVTVRPSAGLSRRRGY